MFRREKMLLAGAVLLGAADLVLPDPEGPETEAATRAGLTDRETAAKDTGDGTERYAEPVPSAAQ